MYTSSSNSPQQRRMTTPEAHRACRATLVTNLEGLDLTFQFCFRIETSQSLVDNLYHTKTFYDACVGSTTCIRQTRWGRWLQRQSLACLCRVVLSYAVWWGSSRLASRTALLTLPILLKPSVEFGNMLLHAACPQHQVLSAYSSRG